MENNIIDNIILEEYTIERQNGKYEDDVAGFVSSEETQM